MVRVQQWAERGEGRASQGNLPGGGGGGKGRKKRKLEKGGNGEGENVYERTGRRTDEMHCLIFCPPLLLPLAIRPPLPSFLPPISPVFLPIRAVRLSPAVVTARRRRRRHISRRTARRRRSYTSTPIVSRCCLLRLGGGPRQVLAQLWIGRERGGKRPTYD